LKKGYGENFENYCERIAADVLGFVARSRHQAEIQSAEKIGKVS